MENAAVTQAAASHMFASPKRLPRKTLQRRERSEKLVLTHMQLQNFSPTIETEHSFSRICTFAVEETLGTEYMGLDVNVYRPTSQSYTLGDGKTETNQMFGMTMNHP
jgi:hypothetical protein